MNFSPRSNRTAAIGRIIDRLDVTAAAVRPAFPLAAEPATGKWQTAADGRWAGGFWVGMLWLAAHRTGAQRFAALAQEWMVRLRPRVGINNVLNGLVFYYGATLGHMLLEDREAGELASDAAYALDRCFNSHVGIFPLGGDTTEKITAGIVETNVDALAAMTLLFWAAETTGNAAFTVHALRHANRVREACQRKDGSFFQTAGFDPGSGTLVHRRTPRGYADDSRWGRAQSWGLLGLAEAAKRDRSLLPAARSLAAFWIAKTAADPIAFWDFDDPAIPVTERDTSATAIAAVALLKIAALVSDQDGAQSYRNHAEATVNALVTDYLTPTCADDERPSGMLVEGCWQRHDNMATKHELIWGDYFLLEALLRLESKLPLP